MDPALGLFPQDNGSRRGSIVTVVEPTPEEAAIQAANIEAGERVRSAIIAEAAADAEQKDAKERVRRTRKADAEKIPTFNISQPIPQGPIGGVQENIRQKFEELIAQLQVYRRQLFTIATDSDPKKLALVTSPDGSQLVYSPAQNLFQTVKNYLSKKSKNLISSGVEVPEEQFRALINSLNVTTILDDRILENLARTIKVNNDTFLSLKRSILSKKSTIDDLNQTIKKISELIVKLSTIYNEYTMPVEKTRSTAWGLRGYKPTETVQLNPEGKPLPPKIPWWKSIFGERQNPSVGGGRRRTLRRRATVRAKTSRSLRSRSRRRSSGSRGGTRRRR